MKRIYKARVKESAFSFSDMFVFASNISEVETIVLKEFGKGGYTDAEVTQVKLIVDTYLQ